MKMHSKARIQLLGKVWNWVPAVLCCWSTCFQTVGKVKLALPAWAISKKQRAGFLSGLWGWKQGCEAVNVTLPLCVWRWNELVNECLSICSASGRCFAKVQVPWGGLATWSSFHDILTKGTPTFRFSAEDGRMLDYCLAECTGSLGGLRVWCVFVI